MGFVTFVAILGGLAGLAAWIWLIVIAFRDQNRLWGTLLIVGIVIPIVGPLLAIFYTILNWQRCRKPAILFYSAIATNILCSVLLLASFKAQIENSPEMQQAIAQARMSRKPANAAATGSPTEATPSPAAKDESRSTPSPPTPASPRPAPPQPKPQAVSPEAVTKAPSSPPAAVDPTTPPATLKMVSLGEPSPNRLRPIRLQIFNSSEKPIREIKLRLTYVDAKKVRLGLWTTVHSDTAMLAQPRSTNEFEMTAFFVPQFTSDVQIEVAGIVFGDSTRWP